MNKINPNAMHVEQARRIHSGLLQSGYYHTDYFRLDKVAETKHGLIVQATARFEDKPVWLNPGMEKNPGATSCILVYYPKEWTDAHYFAAGADSVVTHGPADYFPGSGGFLRAHISGQKAVIETLQGGFRQKNEREQIVVPKERLSRHTRWRASLLRTFFERVREFDPSEVHLKLWTRYEPAPRRLGKLNADVFGPYAQAHGFPHVTETIDPDLSHLFTQFPSKPHMSGTLIAHKFPNG